MKTSKALLKSMEYRALSICITMIVSFTITKDWKLAASITGLSDIAKTILHAIWLKYRG